MGAINFSIDTELVDALARQLPFEVFVETGTYKGDTVDRVKPYFNRLYSIELSDYYAHLAQSRFKDDPMVTILHGDAGVELKTLISEIAGKSALFWLDSHWCDDSGTGGAGAQCSLMKELAAIGQLNADSVILIDDARLFLSPPGQPHDYSQWPDINEILAALKHLSSVHEIIAVNDIIAYFPLRIKSPVKEYAHQHGIDWLHVMDVFRQYDELIAEINTKENEIDAIKRENVVLSKEIEIKEKEITIKQQEIATISDIAGQRLYVINQFEHQFEEARKAIVSGYDGQIEGFKELAAQTQEHLETLKNLMSEKDKQIEALKDVAESRLKVIQDLDGALKAYQKKRFKERLRLWLQPRIGVLYHYPPRPMKIPENYANFKDKPFDSKALPLIFMVTPSFNHVDFIERTIVSVLEQKYPKLQYVIQDGGSNDGTTDILKKYEDRLMRWESKKDKGQADAINLGFKESAGDMMCYLNSDDLLLPGALHYVAAYFAAHSEVDVVYGHRILIDEYDQEIGRWVLPPHDDAVLSWADFIPQETLFWRRSIWEKSGGHIDEEFKFAMDWDLILRFRDAGARFVRLPRFLGAFRVHPHQKTSKEIADQGDKEMKRLRERTLGRIVSEAEINLNLKKYMSRHILFHKLYRSGILRY